MTKRHEIIPKGMRQLHDQFHFSPAVRVGKHVYCSGQVGNGADGSLDPDPAAQFAQAFDNLRTVLEEAGASLEDVVDLTSFHVGLNQHMGVFMQVKDGYLKANYPAWTAVGVTELAFGALVEIKAIARVGD